MAPYNSAAIRGISFLRRPIYFVPADVSGFDHRSPSLCSFIISTRLFITPVIFLIRPARATDRSLLPSPSPARQEDRTELLTFRRVDVQRGSVQTLLVEPVGVPQQGLGRHEANEQGGRDEDRPALPPRPVPPRHVVAARDGRGDDQARAHARQVEDPLRYHEAHVEEEIAGREEGEHEEAEGGRDAAGRGPPPAAAPARRSAAGQSLGAVAVGADRAVVVVVGRPAPVRVAAARPPARAHGAPRGDGAGILGEGRGELEAAGRPPEDFHGPDRGGDQGGVEEGRLEVSRVEEGGDAGHGVHGPVEAERAGAEQHPRARRGQVEEREAASEARGMSRGRVVRAGELWPRPRDPQPAEDEQGQAPGKDADAARPSHRAAIRLEKRETCTHICTRAGS